MYFIGIDVGLSGAISIINEDSIINLIKMPIIKIETGAYKRWYDINKLIEIFKQYSPSTVILEYQRPMSQQGISTTFRLGRGFGLLEGLTSILCNKVFIIDPKIWQNYFKTKYLSKEQINEFKNKNYNAECIVSNFNDTAIKERYIKLINSKNINGSKVRALFIFDLLTKNKNYSIKFKDDNIVDAFLISNYCFIKYNRYKFI